MWSHIVITYKLCNFRGTILVTAKCSNVNRTKISEHIFYPFSAEMQSYEVDPKISLPNIRKCFLFISNAICGTLLVAV